MPKMACPLVPWNANALIPVALMSSVRVTTKAKSSLGGMVMCVSLSVSATYGFMVRKLVISCMRQCVTPTSRCITPIAPAAGSVWPCDVLAPHSVNGPRLLRVSPVSTVDAAPISMGSPSGVPVPCISSVSYWTTRVCATAMQVRIVSCCAGPLGAVSELERPS